MLNLLLRTMYRNRRRYIGYLLAATIAVATFFTFGFVARHPDLSRADLPDVVLQLLLIGQIGVALFALFFVVFFHRFLLRLRGNEFGLLLTLGMSPRQLAVTIWIESLALAAIAGVLGVLLSLLATYGLILGLSRLLGIPPLPMVFAPSALIAGCGFFGFLFVVDAALSARRMRSYTPKQLLVTTRIRQSGSVSLPRIVGGLGCLGVAYTLALVVSANEVLGTASMLPIVVLCAIGTYVLFSQTLVLLLTRLRRRAVSGLVLLITSRLAHRVLDYARILTVVTLLSAGVLTLMSVMTGSLAYIRQTATSAAEYQALVQIVAVALFVSFFLSSLCFIAAASTLYVKVFTQIDEDRRQFAQLRRIGLSRRGLGLLLFGEFVLLFFAPVLIAIVHSTVAIGEVTLHIIPDAATAAIRGTWLAYASVVVGYLAIFTLYCGATWLQYTRLALRH